MPRCYRFDGSAGMDLRPASVLETEDARRTELRRRREPMAVTTRIRMVDQPPCGLLSLSFSTMCPSQTIWPCIRVLWRRSRRTLPACT